MIENTKHANELRQLYDIDEYNYHGGPFDRGSADSYYRRPKKPHMWPEGTYNGTEVTNLSDEELKAYEAGYDLNEWDGDFKDWGVDVSDFDADGDFSDEY